MKGLVLALLFVPMTVQNDMNRLLDYGAQIHIVVPDNEGSGSGVYIEEGLILTAAHLKLEGARFFIDADHTKEALVVKVDTENDLMLLSVEGKHKKAKLGPMPKRLDVVLAVGHPLGNANVIVRGLVADTSNTHLLVDATVIQGMSGGGLYTEDGRLVGINIMSWGDSDSKLLVSVAVPVIKKFLGTVKTK
jgi:S1-C subfamily serine protease